MFEQAVADGKHKAELIAGLLAHKLGPTLSVTENSQSYTLAADNYRLAKAAAASTPINAGTITIRTDINMVFALE